MTAETIAQLWPADVTLERDGIRLEPLTLAHEEGLRKAAADGELWNIRVTTVPEPAQTRGYIEAALKQRVGIEDGPAKNLTPDARARIQRLAKRIYRTLELDGYARIDFRLAADGTPRVLRQEGWTIVYLAFEADAAGVLRPARMTLSYPDLEVRVVVDGWQ